MPRECDFLVIGAGIAGTSCANWLAPGHSVIVLEMEEQPGYHTTGRSVAVYTEAYGPRVIRALAIGGGDFFRNPPATFSEVPLARPHGFLFIAREDQKPALHAALQSVRALSPDIHEVSVREALDMVPLLRPDYLAAAIHDPNTMALDVDAIHQGYIRGLRRSGAEIVTRAPAEAFERRGGKWQVRTPAGDFAAPVVINAAGAWADVVADRIGARRIALQPKRRTVIAFPLPESVDGRSWPVAVDTEEEFYFKVDAGVVLGSPADETPVPPQDAQPEEIDIAITVDRIERATTMKVSRIIRRWAGLRSFVADGVPVLGYDPDVEDFFWCAGQGGYGIETSNSMGRSAAALAAGGPLPDDLRALDVKESDLHPARLRS